jgi:hypothetical protein
MKWFGGVSVLTIAANVVLHLGIAAAFIVAYVRRGARQQSLAAVIGVVLLASMAWMQDDNFTRGFQTQVMLVYLFAMLAFLAYVHGARRVSSAWQGVAFAFAALAMLSMANGLLVFPLLVVTGLVLRVGMLRVALAAGVTIVAWLVYFHGYTQPPFHANPYEAVTQHLLGVVHYAMVFLGSPATFLGSHIGRAAAPAGVLLVVALAWALWSLVRGRAFSGYRVFLLATLATDPRITTVRWPWSVYAWASRTRRTWMPSTRHRCATACVTCPATPRQGVCRFTGIPGLPTSARCHSIRRAWTQAFARGPSTRSSK